ncbi:unnamed protein product [Musa acuminata subsp. malaccensis]|uniref:RNA polymerase II C-terminal domain phosphatase-like n=1 Tax=Musa acuminata subsp. malaccensis TaxID=214687 RepID=A0A804K136_MUSAM|nr:PREDICTED: RNA polymerase II C-terminal domain phosphatase-like 3 [Musa acuminata subsp. malaccensis]CAG1858073.1 unnamed protein product [Musa acuminata subsp. malaccensis]
MTTDRAKEIDALVDSPASEDHDEGKEQQHVGIVNDVLTNSSTEPNISAGDQLSPVKLEELENGGIGCNALDEGPVEGTTAGRKRKTMDEYESMDYTMSSTPFKFDESEHNQAGTSRITPQSVFMCSQDDIVWIGLKPRDPRRVLFKNVIVAPEQNKVDGVIAAPRGTTERSTAREPLLPLVTCSSSVPHSSRIQASGEGASELPKLCGGIDHLLVGCNDQQKAAIHREIARRIMEHIRLLAARKLSLVLDLDHTLLNSTTFVDVNPVHENTLRSNEERDRKLPQRHLFRLQHLGLWIKFRPGIWNFLCKASKLYELHVCTKGSMVYAAEIAKLLDPTGSLFSGRVISRGDDDGDASPSDVVERASKHKDLAGVSGLESAVVIIDDTPGMWPRHQPNLIVVERYHFFPSSKRKFGLPGPSLLDIHRDESSKEGTLASALAVIERIHDSFFSHHSIQEADVRSLLEAEQRKVLRGCRIVFSRVFPVGEANPQQHPLWKKAQQFGAVCTDQIDEHVTHVIATALGTDKVQRALSTGKFVVHPGWIEASTLLYRRANEHNFALGTKTPSAHPTKS